MDDSVICSFWCPSSFYSTDEEVEEEEVEEVQSEQLTQQEQPESVLAFSLNKWSAPLNFSLKFRIIEDVTATRRRSSGVEQAAALRRASGAQAAAPEAQTEVAPKQESK